MQLSVSTLKVQNRYCVHELCDVSQCFVPWLLGPFGFLNLRTVHCRLLRLEELLIGCGNTTHRRFGTSCALSLSKFHLSFTEF